jgi:hypothetical protein
MMPNNRSKQIVLNNRLDYIESKPAKMKNNHLFRNLSIMKIIHCVNRVRFYIHGLSGTSFCVRAVILFIPVIFFAAQVSAQDKKSTPSEAHVTEKSVGGYMIVQTEKVNQSYNAGFSIYSAAWPLLKVYPGRSFQSGLFGTWMFPNRDQLQVKEKLYSDIEGGLGWWRSTAFGTVTPKFIMGGVEMNFLTWANGPGSGKGRDWSQSSGKYGVAQLSPWLLFPPDGLNLKQGTCGEMFGYGYLPLPLTESKTTTEGKNVPTGNQSWTLFLNTENFKGPVAFFTPYYWSKVAVENPKVSGLFLDVLPSGANKAFQMETQFIPSSEASDSKGERYARIAQTQYPVGPDNNSELMNRLMVYNRKALWDGVSAWFKGGNPASGTIDTSGAFMQKFKAAVKSTWRIYDDNVPRDKRAMMNINTLLKASESDSATFRISWDSKQVRKLQTKTGSLFILPEYYQLQKSENDSIGEWIAITPEGVPAETGLKNIRFKNVKDTNPDPDDPDTHNTVYITPDEKESSWKKPGPVAGPFKVKLGDGSTVTYYWYRFADQPALLNADLTNEEREEMQKRVEKIHRLWTKEREYLPPPTVGS